MGVADAAIIEVSGNVSGQTWAGGNTYHVIGNLTVNDGTTLTIQAGAVVKFNPNLQLTVYGTLDVNGADGNNVVFTSRDDNTVGGTVSGSDGSPAAGDWYGIYFYGYSGKDGIGEFDWCRIRYGGSTATGYDANVYFGYSDLGSYFTNSISEYSAQDGVRVYDCSPTLTNSTFANNTRYGLYASGGVPTVTDNTFTSNGGYGAYLSGVTLTSYSGNTGSGNGTNGFGISGAVSADTTWTMGESTFPFVIASTVTVNDNVTLTLPAGTIIKGGSTAQLTVNGTLDANGESGSLVVFTSLLDDEYGGDTNGDGTDTSPAAGDWYGIYLYGYSGNDGIGEFYWCRIRYGGSTDTSYDANVYFGYSDSGNFTDSISEYSAQDGVRVYDCSPTITNSTSSVIATNS